MMGAEALYLKTLSEEADDPGAFDDHLTKAEASKRIDALKTKVERMPKRRSRLRGGHDARFHDRRLRF
jgi:hypothetical protein